MEEVASVVWAVELLGEESPEHCCLGLEVQWGDTRKEPSSTHHPGEENKRKLMREDGEGCKAFGLGESAVDQRLDLLL